ncbi:MAG: hypothetical protein LH606_19440 [Cytophagaceae bacterium]|nr:hypothetical protein [Cytophagaceae bacterium]
MAIELKKSSFQKGAGRAGKTTDEQSESDGLRNALLIAAGVALAAYIAYRILSPEEEETTEDNPDTNSDRESASPSPLWTAAKGAVATFLIGMVRERFSGVIDQFTQRTNAPSRTR